MAPAARGRQWVRVSGWMRDACPCWSVHGAGASGGSVLLGVAACWGEAVVYMPFDVTAARFVLGHACMCVVLWSAPWQNMSAVHPVYALLAEPVVL